MFIVLPVIRFSCVIIVIIDLRSRIVFNDFRRFRFRYQVFSLFNRFLSEEVRLSQGAKVIMIGGPMDPETGCGLPSTGQKVRLLIGTAC